MNLVKIAIILVCIFAVGCKNERVKKDFTEYDISEGIETEGHVFLSTIADNIDYIPLETRPESLLGDISKILFSSSSILVKDEVGQLILFDRNGKYLRKIGSKGHGPQEYLNATSMAFSGTGDELFLFDESARRIMVFDVKSGNCIRTSKLDFMPSEFGVLNDSILAFYCSAGSFPFSGRYNHIFLVNSKSLATVDNLYPREDLKEKSEYLKGMDLGFSMFFKQQNELYFWNSNSDTIFSLNQDKQIIPRYQFKYQKGQGSALENNAQQANRTTGNYFEFSSFIETANYFFLNGIFKGKYARNIIYYKGNKTSKNVVFNYSFHDWGFHNDIDGGIPFWPKGIIDEYTIFDYMSPFLLKKLMSNKYFESIEIKDKTKNKQLRSILDASEMQDNPIIFVLSLKH